MKLIPFAYNFVIAAFFASFSLEKTRESSIMFTGTTPCSNVNRPIHKITPEADCPMEECKCVMVEWKLILFQNPVSSQPTHYELSAVNRFIVKESNMYSQPGTISEREGKWTIIRGTKSNPEAVVYRLNPDSPGISLDFIKLSDKLIHVLDHNGRLMIGNEFWSYTLTRTGN